MLPQRKISGHAKMVKNFRPNQSDLNWTEPLLTMLEFEVDLWKQVMFRLLGIIFLFPSVCWCILIDETNFKA